MSTTAPTPFAERALDSLRRLGPWRFGAIAYLVVALAAGAILGALVVALAWGGTELVLRHRNRPPAVSDGRFHPSRGLVELVIGAVVVRRDGLARSFLWTLFGSLVAVTVTLAAVVAVVVAAHGVALIVAAVVALGVALWRRHDRREHPELWPVPPGDMSVAAYVESRSFPSDTVADFVTSEAGAVTLDEARRVADAYSAGRAAERYEAYRRRSDAARKAHR
jgi:hypothetical protein